MNAYVFIYKFKLYHNQYKKPKLKFKTIVYEM